MLTVIDNGLSVRLLYDNIDVFNHGEQTPFVKFLKGKTVYRVKSGRLTAKFDVDGEYSAACKIKSSSVKSAGFVFSGYNDMSLTVRAAEYRDCVKLSFTPDKFCALKLLFISNPFEKLLIDGEDKKGNKGDNLLTANVPSGLAAKGIIANVFGTENPLAETAEFNQAPSVTTQKGLRYVFDTTGFSSYDFTAKNLASFIFDNCPVTITVYKDNLAKG